MIRQALLPPELEDGPHAGGPGAAHPLAGGAFQRRGRGHRIFLCRPIRHPAQRRRCPAARPLQGNRRQQIHLPGHLLLEIPAIFRQRQLPMAVGVLAMVPARASGVMFSIDPHAPEADSVLISAVWGLGKYAVDGTISPDSLPSSRRVRAMPSNSGGCWRSPWPWHANPTAAWRR